MIDKIAGRDYEESMVKTLKLTWIIGGALVLVLLASGLHPALAQVQDGNPGRGGEALEIKSLLSRDRTTVFDFYSPYCPPCMALAPMLEQLAAKRPELTIVKVNINRPEVQGIDWKSPLAQQYGLKSVPNFKIFNAQGKLLAEGPQALKIILDWLQKAGVGQQSGR